MYDSQLSQLQNYCALNTRRSYSGCVFTMPVVSLNIPESVIITDYVKRIKNHRCFHKEDYTYFTLVI